MPYTPKVRDVILYPVSSSQGETKLSFSSTLSTKTARKL